MILKYVVRRIGFLVLILFVVSTLVFSLIHLVPGDPVDLILGEQAMAADRASLRASLHLDRPMTTQWGYFLKGLFVGDLGNSLFERRPVTEMILERYPATLKLAFSAMVLALLISIPLGTIAAVKKGTLWDQGSMLSALVGISIPHFWLGPLLVIFFSVKLDLLPIAGSAEPGSFILPTITLGSGLAAILTRMTRSSMLDTLREDFVRTARAKGVAESWVVWKHVLRNALQPVVTIAGLQFGALLAGAIVTEKIFSWPGIGSLLMQAIERRDYPVVQGCILCIAFSYSLVNLATDLLYLKIDPRVRLR